MSPPVSRGAASRSTTTAILATVVVLDAILLGVRGDGLLITSWWSSVGLVAALLARSPLRRWPALALVTLALTVALNAAFGVDARSTAIVALSHVSQALVAAVVLTHGARRLATLDSLTSLVRLGAAGLTVGVMAGVGELVARLDPSMGAAPAALQEGMQHALSVVLFGALLLSGDRRTEGERARSPRRLSPVVLIQSAALFMALAMIFVPDTPLPLTFLPLPLLVWGAILRDARFAAGQLLLLGAFTTITTADDPGPFNAASVSPDLVGPLTLGYVACAALVTLPIAIVVGQRRTLEKRSAADEHLFRRTFTESPLGMVLLRAERGALVVTDANGAAGRLLGAPTDELVGRRFADLVGTLDYREHVFDALVTQEVDTWHGPAAVLGRPGSRVDLALAAISGVGGTQTFSAQLLDQTQEQDSRRRLEVAHELTDATLDTAACIILVTDDTGTIVRINGATKDITGYDEQSLVGKLLWEAPLSSLTRSETEAMFVWPNRSGFPMVRERLTYSAEGEAIRVVWNNNVVRSKVGTPSHAVLTGIDVTAERSSAGLMTHLLQASVATALIGIDVAGRITVFNAGAAHMLQTSAEEMLGEAFVSILDPAQLLVRTGAMGEHEAFLCLVGMIEQGDESEAQDWTWRTRNGHELTVSMTLSVTDDEVADRVGFLCVGRDVTEQREGQDTLVAALDKERTAVERLRSLDRAKDEFVSTVSHELRTPVTSILGYAELLLDGDVVEAHPDQVGMLETISRNSHRLIAICNDLLLLSGFESREALSNREAYDLREAIVVAQDFARAVSANRPLSVTFTAPDEPVMVLGDRSQLDRVFVNLVSNAIKFTDDDGAVEIALAHDHELGAVITVGDSGIGIHRDDHDLVFQRFYRTDDAHRRAIPGTGLGLSIVAGIVEAHGGTIELDSAPGEGTTFTVHLPVVA